MIHSGDRLQSLLDAMFPSVCMQDGIGSSNIGAYSVPIPAETNSVTNGT